MAQFVDVMCSQKLTTIIGAKNLSDKCSIDTLVQRACNAEVDLLVKKRFIDSVNAVLETNVDSWDSFKSAFVMHTKPTDEKVYALYMSIIGWV